MATKGGQSFSDTKLSPALIKELSQRNTLGTGYRALEEWVLKEHNIKVSHITIRTKIMKYREDHEELAQEILQEKKEQIREAVGNDLDLIQHEIEAMLEIATNNTGTKKNVRERMLVTDRLVKLIDLRRKYCGIKAPEEEVQVKPVSDELMSKLDDLIQRRKDIAEDKKANK